VENSYLTIAAQYGIASALCFVAFMLSAFRLAWRERTPLAYLVIGIILGFGSVMMVSPLHDVFTLASWIWFPVGMLVRTQ
jgi:O-antigen ligase